jgi:hypothetical protein
MNENRRKILELLAGGKITADEAERLLAALEHESAPPSNGAHNSKSDGRPKFIRVVVSDEGHHGEPTNVNVRVPMQLLRAGVKLVSLIPPGARDQVNAALRREGVPLNLNQIKPENLEELIDHLSELTVDVDGGKKATVRVFCE